MADSKKGKGRRRNDGDDLFADLRDRPEHEVTEELKQLKRRQSVTKQELDAILTERQRQIKVVQTIRGAISDTKGIKSEHKGLITDIGQREKEIRKMRQRRDEINRNVVLPMRNIEKELLRTYTQLVAERKDLRYPGVKEEEKLFAFFLELQVMHPLAAQSNRIHNERLTLIEQQRGSISQLKTKETQHDEVLAAASDSSPAMKGVKATPWEEKAYNRRISKLLDESREKRKELRGINREVGRLDAWGRIKRKGGGRKRPGRGRRGPDIKEVRRKAASGESMSLDDLGALLDSGGFSSLKPEHASDKKRRKKGVSMKKVGASRGKGSAARPDFDERRR